MIRFYNFPMMLRKRSFQTIHTASCTIFFDIFEEEFRPVYEKKEKFLLDFNFIVLNKLAEMSGEKLHYALTKEYVVTPVSGWVDYRENIHPKSRMQVPDPYFEPHPYFQVFSNKFGFIHNLSFIDLLFNEGPQAVFLCRQSIKKG